MRDLLVKIWLCAGLRSDDSVLCKPVSRGWIMCGTYLCRFSCEWELPMKAGLRWMNRWFITILKLQLKN